MYMMYIDDFWNVSNYAIPVKRNSCLNKNSIQLLIACSLESKWTCNSHNNIMYIDGFYPWQRISNVWIICEKKIRNDILPKYHFSCNIWCVTYMYYLYQSFWQFESYFDTVSLFASMHLQLLSHELLITETVNRFCFAV